MNIRIAPTLRAGLMGVLACAAVCSAAAETIVVDSSNSPLMLGGTGADPNNKAGKVYDLRDGAVVCVTNISNIQRIWCNLVATNGTATIQRGEPTGALDYRGALIASGDGQIQVKGYDWITFGVDTTEGTYYGDSYCDAANLKFVDDAGAARAGTFYIYGGMLKALPRNERITFTWEAGKSCVIPPESDWSDLDVFTFPNETVNFFVSHANSLKPGCVVKVPAGRTFGVRPGIRDGKYNPFTYSDNINTGHDSFSVDCSVELNEGSTFKIYTYIDVTCSGVISGPGGVSAGVTRTGEGDLHIHLTGENTFTGNVQVDGDHTHLHLGEKGLPNRRYSLMGQYSHLHFRAPADGGPTQVTLDYVRGEYWSSQLHAAAGQTVTVRQADRQLWAVPDTTDGTSVVDFNPALGPAGIRFYAHPYVYVNGKSVLSESSDAILSRNTTEEIFMIPGANGRVDWSKSTPFVTCPWYRLSGTVVVSNTPASRPIKVLGSGNLSLSAQQGEAVPDVQLSPEAKLTLSLQVTDWRKTAALWLDPNTSQVYLPGDLALQAWKDKIGTDPVTIFTRNYATDKPYIEGMADCRGEGYEYYMAFNDRNYDQVNGTSPKWENLSYMVAAYLDTRVDGMRFINCATGRLPLHRGGPQDLVVNKSAQENIPNATLVVMVFGSQKGGGAAILGTSEGRFARTAGAASNPIVNASLEGRKVWVDGVEVDPTTTGLNGDWQIISAEVTGLTVDGFGWNKRRGDSKGQQYGEIIVFTNRVDDLVRRKLERELATRWQVSSYQYGEEPSVAATVSGTGRATISSDYSVVMSGRFSGTAIVPSGSTISIPAALPWTETEIEATGPTAWFDPSVRSTVSTLTDLDDSEKDRRPAEVRAIWDRRYGPRAEGRTYLFGISYRTPAYTNYVRGIGVEMPWIDHNNLYVETSNDVSSGNVLRFRKWTASTSNIGDGGNVSVGAKTAFIVQDSCRGGSTPLSDGVNGGTVFPKRVNSVGQGIIPSTANANIRTGDVRLNGETVASPTGTGFTGEPEVFSLATANDYSFPVTYFGAYGDSEHFATQAGTIQGEILLYDKYLSPEVRTNVEQYLVSKWVGMLPSGLTDWRSATIDGEGTVKVASQTVAPKLAETFSGTLELGGTDAFAATATVGADGMVTGGLLRPQMTLTLSADAVQPTLEVIVEGKPLGEFPVVNLKALSPVKTWSVTVKKPSGEEVPGAKVLQSRDGASVELKLTAVGTMVLFR